MTLLEIAVIFESTLRSVSHSATASNLLGADFVTNFDGFDSVSLETNVLFDRTMRTLLVRSSPETLLNKAVSKPDLAALGCVGRGRAERVR